MGRHHRPTCFLNKKDNRASLVFCSSPNPGKRGERESTDASACAVCDFDSDCDQLRMERARCGERRSFARRRRRRSIACARPASETRQNEGRVQKNEKGSSITVIVEGSAALRFYHTHQAGTRTTKNGGSRGQGERGEARAAVRRRGRRKQKKRRCRKQENRKKI